MTKRIIITPKASLDIDEHFAYIAQQNSDTALHFFDAVRETFAQLARMPGMGSTAARKSKVKSQKSKVLYIKAFGCFKW
ncbi:type II toxin-antitoxin system RelE/ParE family toxin [Brasilonema sp. UFV-L1]|uniref:type II toxin-antitoxin system RelE/ParE family toxin n=1 Tax=Brasilonema sp. UFV-L1 TaxID=2234130 RepID=UPI00145FBA95|nr:type II toxin-antitoxin system RelE/ParE family toxin [Brasilonema sp. UFV-L1]NMG09488.1 hypothetical protein [Brasilonema sp. UFV-L1]